MSAAAEATVRAARIAAVAREGNRRDLVFSAWWLLASGSIAWMLAAGSPVSTASEALTTVGRAAGVVAATSIMTQLVLIARVPWVEKRIGHDKAAVWHARLGRIGFVVLCAHLVLITAGYAAGLGRSPLDQLWDFATGYGPEILGALVAFVLLLVVVLTSLAAVRGRWPYERWHAVHLVVYVAVLVSIPHQVEVGTSFSGVGEGIADVAAKAYWLTLWVAAIASLVIFRIVVPVVRAWRADVRVVSVEQAGKGSVAVTMSGAGVAKLRASAGQFMLWRFLTPGLWAQAHPFSLSAAPDGRSVRITVKAVGDASAAIAAVTPGTRVIAEGPLGRFTLDHRVADDLVFVAAGSGITPIVAMLAHADAKTSSRVAVILRARSEEELSHLDEVRAHADRLGATVSVVLGSRGHGWWGSDADRSLADLAPFASTADVYVCGPQAWADAVVADALAAGVPAVQIHREKFSW